MKYDVLVSPKAQSDLQSCLNYLREYDDNFAYKEMNNIENFIYKDIPFSPYLWSYFHFTGKPFRASLYRISKRTTYWLVYAINEEDRRIDILRFWNASQNPLDFRI